jgi:hypothetical protein
MLEEKSQYNIAKNNEPQNPPEITCSLRYFLICPYEQERCPETRKVGSKRYGNDVRNDNTSEPDDQRHIRCLP